MPRVLTSGVLVALLLAAPLPSQTSAQRREALERAQGLLDGHDARAAEEAFRRLLLEDPDHLEALTGWARALLAGGRGRAALSSLDHAAQRRLDRGLYREAAELLEIAIQIAPSSAPLHARLGRCHLLDRRFLAAEPPLRRALELGSRTIDLLLPLAAVLWENARLDEAEALYREAVAKAPGSAEVHDQLGRLLLWRSRFEESAAALERAAQLGAEGVQLHLERARALEGWGRELAAAGTDAERRPQLLDQARGAFELAVEAAPEHSEARYGLAQALLLADHPAAAAEQLAAYRRLYEEDQERVRTAHRLAAQVEHGRRLLEEGKPAQAVAALEALPATADSLGTLARAYRQLGRLDAARESLERAVALEPERSDLRSLLSELSDDGPR
ncbi:MAG TPA: tetratricopeptide repeat protein [Planctomycetota bacterium]|nr:tetratricopeptide repeat protein [Planctomycetota bacterium]